MQNRNSTLGTIAKLAGVSISTASRVLAGKGGVRKEKSSRIQRIAREVGYKRNLIARSMKVGRTFTAGVIVSAVSGAFTDTIVRTLLDALEEAGYAAILMQSHEQAEKEAAALHRLLERRVDGIVITPVLEQVNEEYFWELRRTGVPLVVVDRRFEFVACDFVGSDDRRGACLAARHVIDLGHRNIATVAGPQSSYTGRERLQGLKDACVERGIALRPDCVIECPYTEEGNARAEEEVRRLLREVPDITAVVCATDPFAFAACDAARAVSRSVPGDLSIVGFADFEQSRHLSPPLTTVHQPAAEIGRTAARLLLGRITARRTERPAKPPETILLPTHLVVRGSTAPPGRPRTAAVR